MKWIREDSSANANFDTVFPEYRKRERVIIFLRQQIRSLSTHSHSSRLNMRIDQNYCFYSLELKLKKYTREENVQQ